MGSMSPGESASPSFPATPRSTGTSAQQNTGSRTGKAGITTKHDNELAEVNPRRQDHIESASRNELVSTSESAGEGHTIEPSASAAKSATKGNGGNNAENVRSPPGIHSATPADGGDETKTSDAGGLSRELAFSDDDDYDDNDDKEINSIVDFVAAERAIIAARHQTNVATGSGEKNRNGGDSVGHEDDKIGTAGAEETRRSDRSGNGRGGGADESIDDDGKPDIRHTHPGLGPALGSTAAVTPPAGASWVPPDLGFSSEEEGDELDFSPGTTQSSSADLEVSISAEDSSSAREAERGDDDESQDGMSPASREHGKPFGS